MSKTYIAAIIGAGRIGAGFDSPRSREILTHAHAVLANSRISLVALVDTNRARGQKEARRWRTNFYPDVRTMFRNEEPDIVVIATPDETHTRVLLEVVRYRPRLIICEKPIAAQGKAAVQLRRLRIPVIVNFSRRFDQAMAELCKTLKSGRYGKVLSASGIYTKGIFHNGSHMLDLARFLFGEIRSSTAHFRKQDWESELSIGGVATFERCPEFHLILADARAFALFELDIVTEKKRVCVIDEGRTIRTQDVVADPLYKGFRILSRERAEKTKLDRALPELYTHAVNVLDGKERSRVSLSEALKTQAACTKFARSYKKL